MSAPLNISKRHTTLTPIDPHDHETLSKLHSAQGLVTRLSLDNQSPTVAISIGSIAQASQEDLTAIAKNITQRLTSMNKNDAERPYPANEANQQTIESIQPYEEHGTLEYFLHKVLVELLMVKPTPHVKDRLTSDLRLGDVLLDTIDVRDDGPVFHKTVRSLTEDRRIGVYHQARRLTLVGGDETLVNLIRLGFDLVTTLAPLVCFVDQSNTDPETIAFHLLKTPVWAAKQQDQLRQLPAKPLSLADIHGLWKNKAFGPGSQGPYRFFAYTDEQVNDSPPTMDQEDKEESSILQQTDTLLASLVDIGKHLQSLQDKDDDPAVKAIRATIQDQFPQMTDDEINAMIDQARRRRGMDTKTGVALAQTANNTGTFRHCLGERSLYTPKVRSDFVVPQAAGPFNSLGRVPERGGHNQATVVIGPTLAYRSNRQIGRMDIIPKHTVEVKTTSNHPTGLRSDKAAFLTNAICPRSVFDYRPRPIPNEPPTLKLGQGILDKLRRHQPTDALDKDKHGLPALSMDRQLFQTTKPRRRWIPIEYDDQDNKDKVIGEKIIVSPLRCDGCREKTLLPCHRFATVKRQSFPDRPVETGMVVVSQCELNPLELVRQSIDVLKKVLNMVVLPVH